MLARLPATAKGLDQSKRPLRHRIAPILSPIHRRPCPFRSLPEAARPGAARAPSPLGGSAGRTTNPNGGLGRARHRPCERRWRTHLLAQAGGADTHTQGARDPNDVKGASGPAGGSSEHGREGRGGLHEGRRSSPAPRSAPCTRTAVRVVSSPATPSAHAAGKGSPTAARHAGAPRAGDSGGPRTCGDPGREAGEA